MKWFWSCTPVDDALVVSGRLSNRGVTLGHEVIIPLKMKRAKMSKDTLRLCVVGAILEIIEKLPEDHAYFCFNNPTLVHKEEE